jgi:hypothetical protein
MTTKKPYQSPELVLLHTEENEGKVNAFSGLELKFCGPHTHVTPNQPCPAGLHTSNTFGPHS